MPTIRLLEVGVRWPPEPFLTRKLTGLAERGVEVTVASPVGRREARRGALAGVRLVRLPPADEPKIVSILWVLRDLVVLGLRSPRRALRLVKLVRPHRRLRRALPLALVRAAVVQFEWLPVAASFLPLLDTLEQPVAVSLRGAGVNILPHIDDGALARSYPAIFERAATVHCVSSAIADEAARFGLDAAKARVVRPSVDGAFFSPGRVSAASELRVVSVGSLTWVKRLVDGLEAVSLLVRDGVPISYEIVGGAPPEDAGMGSDRDQVLYLVHALDLADHVRFTGAVSRSEVRDILRRSDVLLHPSQSDGFGNSVLEAMACGLPVVITEGCGAREVVSDGVEGFVCPPRQPDALAHALRSLWESPELARRLGDSGRQRVLAEFTLATEIDGFVRLYEELVSQGGATSDGVHAPERARLSRSL